MPHFKKHLFDEKTQCGLFPRTLLKHLSSYLIILAAWFMSMISSRCALHALLFFTVKHHSHQQRPTKCITDKIHILVYIQGLL